MFVFKFLLSLQIKADGLNDIKSPPNQLYADISEERAEGEPLLNGSKKPGEIKFRRGRLSSEGQEGENYAGYLGL